VSPIAPKARWWHLWHSLVMFTEDALVQFSIRKDIPASPYQTPDGNALGKDKKHMIISSAGPPSLIGEDGSTHAGWDTHTTSSNVDDPFQSRPAAPQSLAVKIKA
jgi:hypothetical protein